MNENEFDEGYEQLEYRLTELCQIIPEYEGESILLHTFMSPCQAAFDVVRERQAFFSFI